jgi:hypothetical protein
MCSFLKCPDDMLVIFWLFGIIAIATLLIFFKTRNKQLSLTIFSVFSNIVLFLASVSGSLIFRIYNIEWLQFLAIFVWPLINIILIVWYARKKK